MVHADVLVVGGGAAGVAAAVGAARAGARVVLVERYGSLGGQATSAWVGSICGLFHRGPAPAWAVAGFVRELGEQVARDTGAGPVGWSDGLWFQPYDPFLLRRRLDGLLEREGVEVRLHAQVVALSREREGWRAGLWWWDRGAELRVGAVVDTSGVAAAARLAGAELLPEEPRQAGALAAKVVGLPEGSDEVVAWALLREVSRGVAAGELPEEARGLSWMPGSRRAGVGLVKLAVAEPLDHGPAQLGEVEARARATLAEVAAGLAARPGWGGFAVVEAAPQLGVRTGPRPRGRAVLGEEDVLAGRRPADGVAVGAWPIERWTVGRRPELRMAEPGTVYTVGAGCLRGETPGLWFGGRCLSADERGVGSARVIGTSVGTGYAAGVLAALSGDGEGPGVARARRDLGLQEDR